MFRVLIHSLCITNPLTLNLSPSFWVIHSFPIPLETIKRNGDFYFDLCESTESNGLVSTFLPLQKNGDFTGDRLTSCWSISKWVEPIFVYICICATVVYVLHVVYMFVWIFLVFRVLGDLSKVLYPDMGKLKIGREV